MSLVLYKTFFEILNSYNYELRRIAGLSVIYRIWGENIEYSSKMELF